MLAACSSTGVDAVSAALFVIAGDVVVDADDAAAVDDFDGTSDDVDADAGNDDNSVVDDATDGVCTDGWADPGVLPEAAAVATAAYFNGGNVGAAGRVDGCVCCTCACCCPESPALSTLAIGCCPKLGFGGGGGGGRTEGKRRRIGQGALEKGGVPYLLLPLSVLIRKIKFS